MLRTKGKTGRFALLLGVLVVLGVSSAPAQARQPIKALYVALADHYAGIVAFEKYRDEMVKADYTIVKMKSWPLLRGYFTSGNADLAYILCPMAMDMFDERPNFRWVSLLHRDGNALAINDLLSSSVDLPQERIKRKPDQRVAAAFAEVRQETGRPSECAVPSLLSTHTVALYKYLKDHGLVLGLRSERMVDVAALEITPSKSPSFLRKKNSRRLAASLEQSLPWAEVAETQEAGQVAWYSKDVLPWPHGHVECIAIATDSCIDEKKDALKEVITYLHRAGRDIEEARRKGGPAMVAIVGMIRKHIPEHDEQAILQSLRVDLNVINYKNLNLDKGGLRQIMDLAVEGGILERVIDIEAFADESFETGSEGN